MNRKLNKIFIFAAMLFLPFLAGAADFGLLLNQYAGVENPTAASNDKAAFEYKADILPRVSFLIGDTGSFFASAGFALGYNDEFYYVPELLRTEFSMLFGAFGINAGRMNYTAPYSFIAEGLFDGVRLSHTSQAGAFSLGAWYSGLQYKKNTVISITAADRANNNSVLDYGDFGNTYFSSRRVLTALEWRHPSLLETLRLNASVLGQFDVSDIDEKFHSQYFTLKAGLPVKSFLFEAGGSLQTAQSDALDANGDIEKSTSAGFALEAGILWSMPTSFNSRLLLNFRYASGESDGAGAFIPVTSKYMGRIFQPINQALTSINLNYSARAAQTIGVSIDVSYFLRNDLETWNNYALAVESGNEGKALGAELFANIVWSPFSDLQFNLGGGLFIPSMGDVWESADPLWKAELTAVLAIF